jgi:hypothetical protein
MQSLSKIVTNIKMYAILNINILLTILWIILDRVYEVPDRS